MLEIKNLDIWINTKCFIHNLTLNLNKKDKMAIIGEEGNGKSTLLKVIAGICDYVKTAGVIKNNGYKIGYLPQFLQENDLKKKAFDFVINEKIDFYEISREYYYWLKELDIQEKLLNYPMNQLSGGEKVKFAILKILIESPDILLFDEPTNDLDLESLKWLEKFIQKTDKPILFISHDETLLINTANRILHMELIKKKEETRHTIANVSYDEYMVNRNSFLMKEKQIAYFEKREYHQKKEKLNRVLQKVEHQQNTISRKNPHGAKMLKKKMHTLKSQEKKLSTLPVRDSIIVEKEIFLKFKDILLPNKKQIINYQTKLLQVENKILLTDINFSICGSEHIVIIGKNGCGKTTFIKKIYEQLKTREDIKVGYMPQNYEDIFKKNQKVLDFLSDEIPSVNISLIRSYLGNLNFTHDEMLANVDTLSGGTKAKLFLIKFILEEKNVLILDEPTRNISPLSNPVIRNLLKNFQGAIISISHDRKYIKEVCDTIYQIKAHKLIKINKDIIAF